MHKRCCNLASGNRRTCCEDRHVPVLSAECNTPAPIADAASVLAVASSSFKTDSERVEYCKWHGISYERARAYLPAIRRLERTFREGDAESSFCEGVDRVLRPDRPSATGKLALEADGEEIRVVMPDMPREIFDQLVAADMCPLCTRPAHALRNCPFLPDELRPFC